MVFSNSGFGNTLLIDGITIFNNSEFGVGTIQGNNSFTSIQPIPAFGIAWGYLQHSKFQTKSPMTINAQAQWDFPNIYASIIDGVLSDNLMSYGNFASNAVTSLTTISITLTQSSGLQMLLLFITSNNTAAEPSITDLAGNTWILRTTQLLNGSSGAIFEYYAITTTAYTNNTITITFNASTDIFCEGVEVLSTTAISFIPVAQTYTSSTFVTLGTTPLIFIKGDTQYASVLSYFGGQGGSSQFTSNIGNSVTNSTVLTSGSGIFTIPDGVPWVNVMLIGGGGGGGGAASNNQGGSGGGGAGGYINITLVGLTGDISYSVGAGGAGGGYSTAGSAGGDTTFNGITAYGGGGGASQASSPDYGGYSGQTGTEVNGGSNSGVVGQSSYWSGGGGGGSADGGNSALYAGGAGQPTSNGGGGGASFLSPGGNGGTGANNGQDAPYFGGGGGGSGGQSSSPYPSGGSGGGGIIIITY
jgi:hypothetical protein